MRERCAIDVQALIASVTPALTGLRTEGPGPLTAREAGAADHARTAVLRRALQEWGVQCRQEPGLAALESFGIASERGLEITVAADLRPADEALAYARCFVRLGLEPARSFATWFQYRDGCVPAHQTTAEHRATAVVDAMARALVAGRLEAAPRCLLRAETSTESPPVGLWSECSRALLSGLHRASNALYWRSDSYQVLRASPPMVVLTSRVHALLSARAA